jgi:hypothetical protein
MPLHPAILALLGVSAVVSALLGLAGVFAVQILRHWDFRSGAERQLILERRTYLIATLVAFALLAGGVTLLLFVYTAESLADQFVGAMCATGVLNVNPWGWPTLYLKIVLFFAASAWLALHRLDRQGRDYPLVRPKYGLLLALIPLAWAETLSQWQFFLGLDPDVITSCCGALFTPAGRGVAAQFTGVAPGIALTLLYGLALATCAAGLWAARRGRGGVLFAGLALAHLLAALVAIVSVVALYVYEHPHHHCPFCLLKAGHGYVGYWLYLPLFAATAWGLGAGVISPWQRLPSLAAAAPREVARQSRRALAALLAFHGVAAWAILSSSLTLQDAWW